MYIEYIAVFFTIVGEFILGFGKPELVPTSYLFFLLGNILWIRIGMSRKMPALIILNVAFLILGTRVIINWL
jgi:hypothetical protein